MATISKSYSVSCAHHIPGHKGKCARRHGHTYNITVAVRGNVAPMRGASDDGMVLDYYDLDAIVRTFVNNVLDHRDLNEVLVTGEPGDKELGDAYKCIPRSTAELIACAIYGFIYISLTHLQLHQPVFLDHVIVKESPETAAIARYDDWETVGFPFAPEDFVHRRAAEHRRGVVDPGATAPTQATGVEGGGE